MTDGSSSPLKFLDQASKLGDDEIHIEFSVDRIQHFVCVKIILFLAVAAKVTELLNGNLSCYAALEGGKGDNFFNMFANAYCWESPSTTSGVVYRNCNTDDERAGVIKNPQTVTNVMRWLPYYFLVKALLSATPSAFWHYRIGGRLTGHLNFVKLLVQELTGYVKKLPCAIPESWQRHRETAAQLDGLRKFGTRKMYRYQESMSGLTDQKQKHIESTLGDKIDSEMAQCNSAPAKRGAIGDRPTLNNTGADLETGSLFKSESTVTGPGKGKLLDRHLFSMLCYDNFSSFVDFLYFKSICKATFFAHFKDEEGLFPLNQGILRQWCHKDNFSGRFLVIRYYIRHAIAITVSLAMLRLDLYIFELMGSDIWSSDSFRCDVFNYEDREVLCTLHRRTIALALLLLDVFINLFCFSISVYQLRFVSTNRERESSCFFENLDDRGSLAMLAALRKLQRDNQ